MINKMIFDLGFNNGCSVRKFISLIPDFEDFEVFCFEPGSVANSKEASDTVSSYDNITLFKQPVSITGEKIVFYEHTTYPAASTTWANKANDTRRRGDCGSDIKGEVKKIELEAINFPQFFKDKMNEKALNSFVILKCDIEGEEYNILPEMIKLGLFRYINVLHIEWHEEWKKIDAMNKEEIIEEARKQNPNIFIDDKWSALGY